MLLISPLPSEINEQANMFHQRSLCMLPQQYDAISFSFSQCAVSVCLHKLCAPSLLSQMVSDKAVYVLLVG